MVPLGDFHIFLEVELFHPRFVGGDGGALDPHAAAFDRLGRLDRHPVLGGVAILDAEIEVVEADVQEREDQLVLDHLPDDPGHLVAVDVHHRIGDADFGHGRGRALRWRGGRPIEVNLLRSPSVDGAHRQRREVAHLPPSSSLAHKQGVTRTDVGLTPADNDFGVATLPDGTRLIIATLISGSIATAAARGALVRDFTTLAVSAID